MGGCLAGLACLIASCGDGAPAPRGVQHLTLTLADGGAPGPAIARTARRLGREALDDPAGPWALRSAGAGGTTPVELAREGALQADLVQAFEVELDAQGEVLVRLSWLWSGEGRQSGEVRARPRAGAAVIDLFHHQAWTGEVRDLELEVTSAGDEERVATVAAVTPLDRGFVDGFEPDGGDAGLLPLGHLAHRAFPTDLGAALYARADVPAGAVLELHVSTGRAYPRGAGRRPEVALWARRRGAWEPCGVRELPARALERSGWHRVAFDLSGRAGRGVELALVGDVAAPPGARREPPEPRLPERPALYFGSPAVVVPGARDSRPDVVLVTLDTTRADRLEDADLAPAFDRLRARGRSFDAAWSTCNATAPSHASLLTGLHVGEHGTLSNRSWLDSDLVTLPEVLRAAGYRTGAAVSVEHIEAGTGFGQGFDRFWQADPRAMTDGAVTTDRALEWIDEWTRGGEEPFFLWVHLFDAHSPYHPPREFLAEWTRGREVPPRRAQPPTLPADLAGSPEYRWLGDVDNAEWGRFRYGACIAYADRQLARLADALEPRLARTVLVVTADHGELLGEHGSWFNHRGIWPETLRVPLLVVAPGVPGGTRARELASGVDVARTVLAAADVAAPASFGGRDLLAAGGPAPEEVWFEYTRLVAAGSFDGRHLLLVDLAEEGGRPPELYDVAADPELARELSAEEPELVARKLEALARWRAERRAGRTTERDLSAEQEAELHGLGYAE